jgi:hypothetical protein
MWATLSIHQDGQELYCHLGGCCCLMCQCNHTYNKHAHSQIAQIGFQSDTYVNSSLIDKMPNLEAWKMQQECSSRSPQVMPYLGVPWRCRPCACVKRQRQRDFLSKCDSGSHLMDYQIPLQIVSISVCVRRTLLQTPHKNP